MSSHQSKNNLDSSSSTETSVHPSYRMHHESPQNRIDMHYVGAPSDADQFHQHTEYFGFDLSSSIAHPLGSPEESLLSGSTSYSTNSTLTSKAEKFHFLGQKPKKEPHTPRPPNSFIIYRREKHAEIIAESKNSNAPNNNVISKIVANMWRQEPPEVKTLYTAKAEEEKRLHMIKYPDYKYKPRKNTNGKKAPKGSAPCRKKRKTSIEPFDIPTTIQNMSNSIIAPPNYPSSEMHYFVPFELQFGWTEYDFPHSSFASPPNQFSTMTTDVSEYTDQSSFHV